MCFKSRAPSYRLRLIFVHLLLYKKIKLLELPDEKNMDKAASKIMNYILSFHETRYLEMSSEMQYLVLRKRFLEELCWHNVYVGLCRTILIVSKVIIDSTTNEVGGGGNSNRSKPKKTSFRIQQLVNEIGKMLSAGRLDREIMEELQIKRSQYYEYKSKLFQQSAELFDRFNYENRDSLIYQKELLSERLTRLYKRAELDLTQSTPAEGGNNRASIYLAAQNIAINILKLESEGLRILANGQGRQLRGFESCNETRSINEAALQKRAETEYDESKIY
jgi:hypothetical protein